MTAPTPEMIAALAPLREALLRRAGADAGRTLAQARREAAAVLGAAELAAADVAERARARGEAEAAELLAAERARARRVVRAADLGARATAYERLRTEVVAAVRGLRDEPGYPRVRARLVSEVRRLLGPDADITDAPEGGVLARAAGARVDRSLDAFAERAVTALGPEFDGMWAP